MAMMNHVVHLKFMPDTRSLVRAARIIAKHLTQLADELEQEGE